MNAGATIDPVPGNNTDTDVGAPAASADLSINKQATGALVAGQPATYQLRVDNFGPSNAAAPVISDTLPAGPDVPQLQLGPSGGHRRGIVELSDGGRQRIVHVHPERTAGGR